jgi:hypothetical protein
MGTPRHFSHILKAALQSFSKPLNSAKKQQRTGITVRRRGAEKPHAG